MQAHFPRDCAAVALQRQEVSKARICMCKQRSRIPTSGSERAVMQSACTEITVIVLPKYSMHQPF